MLDLERMAKVDWEEHKRRHREEYPELTLAAYAEKFGLKPSTARRAMGGVKAEARKAAQAKRPSKTDHSAKTDHSKSDHSQKSDHSAKNDHLRSDHSAPNDHLPPASASDKKQVKSGRYKRGVAASGGRAAHASEQPAEQIPKVGNRKNDHLSPPSYRNGEVVACMEPLTAQDHTGGYVTYLNMDEDILEAALALATDDGDLTLASGRYLQLLRCKSDARKRAVSDYAAGQKWCYPGTETEMPLEMAVMQTETAPAQRLAELERYIGGRKSALWRQRKAEREEHPFSRRERVNLTTEILADRKKHGWSALETAQELEAVGLSLPESLKMEVAREVGFIEPRVDTDGGISDEELEAQSRAYMAEQTELMGSWLPHRREEVAKALAEEVARQNGDLIEEDDFDPLPEAELPAPQWDDDDSEPLTEVEEVWQ